MDLDGSNDTSINTGIAQQINGMGLDESNSHLYYAQFNDLRRIDFDGSNDTSIRFGGGAIEGITVSPLVEEVIYAQGSSVGAVQFQNIWDFNLRSGLNPVYAVDRDPLTGKLYFSEHDNLRRMDFDGSNETSIIDFGGADPIEAVAVDYNNEKVYYALHDNLRRIDFDGSNDTGLIDFGGADPIEAIGLDLDASQAYYSVHNNIRRIDLDGSNDTSIATIGSQAINSLALQLDNTRPGVHDNGDANDLLFLGNEVFIQFDQGTISTEGNTTLSAATPHPNILADNWNFYESVFGGDMFYDIDTTATFTGSVTITFDLLLATNPYPGLTPFAIHDNEDGTYNIIEGNLIGGTLYEFTFNSLSPFGIAVNPEPTTLLLLGSALLGYLPFRKRSIR